MNAKYIEPKPLIVPRTFWNVNSIFRCDTCTFQAVNQREWMLLRLGIHPLEIAFMDCDTIYFLISEFYCLDASIQWELIHYEENGMFNSMVILLSELAIDPLKGKIN